MRTPEQRKALTALLLLLPVPTLAVLAAMLWLPETHIGKIIFGFSKLWILLLPFIWRKFVEKHPLSLSPAKHGGWAPALWSGVGIALVIFGSFLLVRHWGWIDEQTVRDRAEMTGLATKTLYIACAIYWITFNSLTEEYVWRWFVFRQFEKLVGGRWAVVASALGFTLHHIFAVALQFDWRITALASTGVFTGGLIWSWLYLRYRSVWPCWLSHAIVDVPIFVAGWIIIFG